MVGSSIRQSGMEGKRSCVKKSVTTEVTSSVRGTGKEKLEFEKKLSDPKKRQQLEADISSLKSFTLCFDGCISSHPGSIFCPTVQSKYLLRITNSECLDKSK